MKKRIFVCSPYRGNIKRNILYARECCKYVLKHNYVPFAPHLLYTQFLIETDSAQRELGIRCGLSFMTCCDEIWVFGPRITEGMSYEIKVAKALGLKVRFKDLNDPIRPES